jgi:hypothetical protein
MFYQDSRQNISGRANLDSDFWFLTMFGIRHHLEISIAQGSVAIGGLPQRRT